MTVPLGAGSRARQQMTQRMQVDRPTVAAADAFGHPTVTGSTTIHAALPCRAWTVDDRDIKDADKLAVVGDIMAIIPADADVLESDSVAHVKDREGRTIHAGPAEVQSVVQRVGHQRLRLRPRA